MHTVIPLVLAVIGSVGSEVEQFSPNHLFVSSFYTHDVLEFDESGTFVRSWNGGSSLSNAEAVTFGPNGHMYVTSVSDDSIYEVDASNALVNSFDLSATYSNLRGLLFGPGGNLFVAAEDQDLIIELDPDGAVIREIGSGSTLDAPRFMTFGTDGHLFVASNGSNEVLEFDPDGQVVRTISIANGPQDVVVGEDGDLFVMTRGDAKLHRISSDGTLEDTTDLTDPWAMSIGPDGCLYVSNLAGDVVERFQVGSLLFLTADGTVGVGSDLDEPGAIAFGPWRYKVKLSGEFSEDDFFAEVKENAELSVCPGSWRIMLCFDEAEAPLGEEDVGNYADIFGYEAFVGYGNDTGNAKNRLMSGYEVWPSSLTYGIGHLELVVKGKTHVNGDFRLKNMTGWFSRSAGDDHIRMQVKVKKSLN